MDYQILQTEINTDPLGRGYSGMSHQEVTDDLNTEYRSYNKAYLTGSEIWENTNAADYAALTDQKKLEWISFCGISEVDPFGPASAFVQYIFGAGSNTVTSLASARVGTTSRSKELLGEPVFTGNIEYARSL